MTGWNGHIMVLNENLRFEDANLKRAFLRTPARMRLSPLLRLYKWTNRPLVNARRISPWWSFVESTRLPSGVLAVVAFGCRRSGHGV